MRVAWLPALAAWGGCAYPVEQFQADADAAICEWKAECFDEESTATDDDADDDEEIEACLDEAEASWEEPGPECDYDPEAAKDCVDQLELLTCPMYDEVVLPEVCDEIWACP